MTDQIRYRYFKENSVSFTLKESFGEALKNYGKAEERSPCFAENAETEFPTVQNFATYAATK